MRDHDLDERQRLDDLTAPKALRARLGLATAARRARLDRAWRAELVPLVDYLWCLS